MQNYVFGADIGGTSIKLGLFSADGKLLEKWEIPTRTVKGGAHVLPNVAQSITTAAIFPAPWIRTSILSAAV